jgi:membrane associated rhomboid family serine protease
MLSITLIIIILTAIVSFTAFSNEKIINDLIFYPPAVTNQNQWYRFWSCALIHSDITHLAFNMLSLWMFGEIVENAFASIFPGMGKTLYVALYLITQFICLLPTYLKNKNNYQYRSLGASGAVSAVVFVGIMLAPTSLIGFFIVPPFIPAFIFAPLYLILSAYLDKKGRDNINHSAHIWGSLGGVVFFVAASYLFSSFDPIHYFVSQVQSYF